MKWNKVEAGQLLAAFQKFVVALGERAEEIIDKIINVDGLVERVIALILNNGYELTASQARAKDIMGKNFLGVEEGTRLFGIQLNRRQLAYMSEIPFSEATLTACKDTHILVAVMPLAIVQIRSCTEAMKLPKGQKSFFNKQTWYDGQAFANEVGQLEWRLVRKTPLEKSISKIRSERQTVLDTETEEMPTLQVMVYTIIGYLLNTGERLFEKVYVLTSSRDSMDVRVSVGRMDADGLVISNSHCLGISSSRKLES